MKRNYLGLAIALLGSGLASADQASDSTAVGLTVYNGGYALVRDQRTINLKSGQNSVEVPDVAAMIDPTSVLLKSIDKPQGLEILEQNYQYDVITPDNILDKSVGANVTIRRQNDQNGKAEWVYDTGTLLNPTKVFLPPDDVNSYGNSAVETSTGGVVVRLKNGSVLLRPEGEVILEKLPDGLHPRPLLNWLVKSADDGAQKIEVSYMTNGIGWSSDYVALVGENDDKLDLAGWVTMKNNSGATYKDAQLTLLAGDVKRIQPAQPMYKTMRMASMSDMSESAPQFEEKSFFEYHIYNMQRPTTIRDRESKQLSLLNAAEVPAHKEMIYDPRGDWWRGWFPYSNGGGDPGGGMDTSNNHKVKVVLEVKNAKENNMGMPLPKGKVRVYKKDSDGRQQFIGEDEIDHTPKDETIRLYIGDAFDVVGDFKRTDYSRVNDHTQEEAFEIKIRNHKATAVDVSVVDYVWSDWKIVKKSQDYKEKDAHTIEFPVHVEADGEAVITYRVRTEW
ncbi:DUF4139 domain-containing protein [soil metagenome]